MPGAEILEYYRRGGERDRLAAGRGRLEFLRTWDVLNRVLPGPPAQLLDVGGATGIYAGPLAAGGYRVCVLDPLPEHAIAAATLPGVVATVGDARALPFADGSVDGVLLLGPLYHLIDRAERVSAWTEAGRVLRPGGVVVAATISRFASLFDGFVNGYFADSRFRPTVEHALIHGEHRSEHGEYPWFTSAYFHHAGEAATEARQAGLVVASVIAVESPLWMVDRIDQVLSDEALTEVLLDLLRRVEQQPGLLAASSHLLTIAHRPATVRGSGPSSHTPMMAPARAQRLRRWQDEVYRGTTDPTDQTFEYLNLTLVVPPQVQPITPVSHLLGEAVVAEVRPGERVLDLGTGSGVNAILAASMGAAVVAVDINPDALAAARENAIRNGVANAVEIRYSDVFDNVDGKFDLIIFDPPFRWFAARDVREAASTDEDYRALTAFFRQAADYLAPSGRMLIFFGTTGDLTYLRQLAAEAGFAEELIAHLAVPLPADAEPIGPDRHVEYLTLRLTR